MSAPGHGSKHGTSVELDHGSGGGHGGDDHGEGNWLISYADLMTLLVGFFVILLSFSTVDQEKYEEAKKSITKQFGGNYQKPFSDFSDRIKEMLEKLGSGQYMVKSTESGVEISFLGTVFFVTGSADLKPEAKNLLNELLPAIKTEGGGDFDVTVEGHTDDVPIVGGGTFRNNWELSSVRACRVLEYFLSYGFDRGHLTAVGYADTRPVVANRDDKGNAIPENQSQNRRVVLRLTKRDAHTL